VPDVVIGEPDTDNPVGVVMATDETVAFVVLQVAQVKCEPDVPEPPRGESAVTEVRYEPAACFPLNVFQSVFER
jgi:hypothetical protein